MPQFSLTYVVCAAPLASRCPELAGSLVDAGWDVTVVATPSADSWIDHDAVEARVRKPPISRYRNHDEPKRAPRPDVIVACPLTFNTINKVAAGISDTYALGVLNEGLGVGTPIVGVPVISERLWGHPALTHSLERLAAAGVVFLDPSSGETGAQPLASGEGPRIAELFEPVWLLKRVDRSSPIL